jgi:tetratricopeptide (TPR) repeat protein
MEIAGLGSAQTEMDKQAQLAIDPKDQDVPSIYSYMGLCLKDLGQYREALAAVHKAEVLDRERTDVHNLMGYCYYKLKEHEKAIDCFKRVLELNPAHPILKKLLQLDSASELQPLIIEQIYESALLVEGLHPDPSSMVARIQQIIDAALK